MTNRVSHRVLIWVAVATVAALSVAAVVVAAGAGPDRRTALMAQLQRPAVATAPSVQGASVPARAHGGRVSLTRAGRSYSMALSPNRASAHNRLTLAVAGAQLPGAAVTVAFSMPAMNMWRAFSLALRPMGAGRYAATMPFVGMSGVWRLDVRVTLPGHAATTFAVADVLGS